MSNITKRVFGVYFQLYFFLEYFGAILDKENRRVIFTRITSPIPPLNCERFTTSALSKSDTASLRLSYYRKF